MTRRDTLSRQKVLQERAEHLRKKLASEQANLRDFNVADPVTDSVDLAFRDENDDMSTQLAERDTHELSQIEQALLRLEQGTYGICQGEGKECKKRVSPSRLKALPYALLCIDCERELEKKPDFS